MEERFSGSTQQVVAWAQDEARRLGHNHIGTEHLLLGILGQGESPAANALTVAGATLDGARDKVLQAVGPATPSPAHRELAYSERARRALERASRLSLRQRAPDVTPEHVLVSVLDVEGRAGQVLRGLGVDVNRLRGSVDPVREDSASGATIVAKRPSGHFPACAQCGASLQATLTHRRMTSTAQLGEPPEERPFVIAFCSACGSAFGASPE